MHKSWGSLLFVISKIYTDKVLASIMENHQVCNAVNVIDLGFFFNGLNGDLGW